MTAEKLKIALTLGKNAWDRYGEFRDRNVEKTYETLLKAADNYDNVADSVKETGRDLAQRGSHALEEPAEEAGKLTALARKRVARALEEARSGGKDFRPFADQAQQDAAAKLGWRVSKRTKRRAQDAAGRAADRAQRALDKKNAKAELKRQKKELKKNDEEKKSSLWRNLGLAALTAAIVAAVAYWYQSRRQEPAGTEVPRVEEHAGSHQSELVYSTSTPTGEDARAAADEAESGAATTVDPEAEERRGGAHELRDDR